MRRRLNGGKGHLIERERERPGETCGLKGFKVGGRADLREPGSQGTPSIASSRNYTFERSYYLR